MNFSENLLTKKDNSVAITFISESGYKEKKTWSELNTDVIKVSKFLKNYGNGQSKIQENFGNQSGNFQI